MLDQKLTPLEDKQNKALLNILKELGEEEEKKQDDDVSRREGMIEKEKRKVEVLRKIKAENEKKEIESLNANLDNGDDLVASLAAHEKAIAGDLE